MLFSDQVEVLATWFKNWNECEQTVALYSLLKRVKKCQAKFLARCLEHCLNDCDELYPIEKEANDHEFVSRLFTEPQKSIVIDQLLSHLPLLRPGNELAKSRYLQILPMVLTFAIERSEYLEESRQLLSYSLIHPAFDNKERHLLTSWMSGLDGRMSSESRIPSSQGDLSPEVSSNTNSLELGATANGLSDWNHNNVGDESTSLTNSLKDFATHCASQSDVSSPSSVATNSLPDTSLQPSPSCSGSEQLADGMADVRTWLKSLRLHKYDYLFTQMTYEDMMELTPDKLDEKNVTKGARNKIILSIKKLHERFKQLQALENEILGGGSLRAALIELKTMIQTPIKRFESKKPAEEDESSTSAKKEMIEEGDIPALYTKVMGKACTQLLVSKPDEENITLYLKLLERCLQHPAFTEVQKRRLRSWKQQVNKMYRSLPRNTRPPGPQRPQGPGFSVQRRQRTPFAPQLAAPRPLNPLNSPPLRPMGMGFQSQNMGWYGNGQAGAGNHLGNIDPARKAASYDPRLGQRMFTENDEAPSEINTRLDSLCLSVAEHALADGLDGVSTL